MEKKTIDTICWWIPFKILRNAVREYLNQNISMAKNEIEKYLCDKVVKYSNFSGMKYIEEATGSALFPKLLGSYEEPIAQWISDIESRNYSTIIDVGCAEGYYAVGFAYRKFADKIIAYDINENAILLAKKLAKLNDLESKIEFRELCDYSEIKRVYEKNRKMMIFCDIEGAEKDLLDNKECVELNSIDIIVETHDFIDSSITNTLIARFKDTHRIEIVSDYEKNADRYPDIVKLSCKAKHMILDERRPKGMLWLRMISNKNVR